jgi:hypothetical protein
VEHLLPYNPEHRLESFGRLLAHLLHLLPHIEDHFYPGQIHPELIGQA